MQMWSRNNKITEILRELSQQNPSHVASPTPNYSISPTASSEQQQQHSHSCTLLVEDINYIQQCYVTREDNILHMRVFLMQVLDTGGNKSAAEIKQAIAQIQVLEKHRQAQEDEIIEKYESFRGTQQPTGSTSSSASYQQPQSNTTTTTSTQSPPSLIKILCYKIFSKITKLSSAYLSKIQLFFPKLFEILLPEQLQLSNALKEAQSQLISSSTNAGLSLGRVFARIAQAGRIKLQREILRLQSFQCSQLQTLGQEKHRNKQNERFYSDKHMQGVNSLKYVIGLQKKFFLKTTLHPKRQGQQQQQQNDVAKDSYLKKEVVSNGIFRNSDIRVEQQQIQQPLEDILFMEKKNSQQAQSVQQSGNGQVHAKEHESILEVILGSYDRQLKEWMHSNRAIHYKIKVYSNQINNANNNSNSSNASKNTMNTTTTAASTVVSIRASVNQPIGFCNRANNKDPKISLLLYSPRLPNNSYHQKPNNLLTITTPKLTHPADKQQQQLSSSSAQSITAPSEDISPLQKIFHRFPHSSKELMRQQVDRYGDVYDYDDDDDGYDNSIRSMEITDKAAGKRDGTASTNSTVTAENTDSDKYQYKTGSQYQHPGRSSFMLSTTVAASTAAAPTKAMAKLMNTSGNLVPRYSVLSAEQQSQSFQQPSALKNLLKTQENSNNLISSSTLRQSHLAVPSSNHTFTAKNKNSIENNTTTSNTTTLTRLTSLEKNQKSMILSKTSSQSYQQRTTNSQQQPMISSVSQLCNGSAPFSLVYEQSLLLSQQLKLKQNKKISSDEPSNTTSTRKSSSSSSKAQLQIVATKFFTLQSAQKAVTNQAMKGMMAITTATPDNSSKSFNSTKIPKKEEQIDEEINFNIMREENMKNKKSQKNQVSWYGESLELADNDNSIAERHTQSVQVPAVSASKPPIQEFRRLQLNEVAKQIDSQILLKQQQQQYQPGVVMQEQHSPVKSAREQVFRTSTTVGNSSYFFPQNYDPHIKSSAQSITATSNPQPRCSPAASFFLPAKSVGNGYLRTSKKDSLLSNLSSELQNQANPNNATNSAYKNTTSSTIFLASEGKKPSDLVGEQIPVGPKMSSNHSSSSSSGNSHRIMNLTRDAEVIKAEGESHPRSTETTAKNNKIIRNHKNNNNNHIIPAKTAGGSSIRVGGYLSSPLIGSPTTSSASGEATDTKAKLTFHCNKDIPNPLEISQSTQKNFVISPARKLLNDSHSGMHSFYSLHSQIPSDTQTSQASSYFQNPKGLFSATNLERSSAQSSSKLNLQSLEQPIERGIFMQVSK